ncbi:MAG: 4-(cytidine 5'-diphospho)-2-C-methyl-D-erythritol kinase [Verrucomicrobiales bacterium]
MRYEAPAKLNLSLRILRKRDDGFHDLESIMVTLPGLHDLLSIETAAEDSFHCDTEGVPTDATNLVVRAIDCFRKKTGFVDRFTVHLEKNIPHGAGLGGGSSDAAFALKAVNELTGQRLSHGDLEILAAELGSDVPFFLGEGWAKVSGRGEQIEICEPPLSMPVLLLKPSFGVSTPVAYQSWLSAKEIPGVPYRAQDSPAGLLVNDLERPVYEKHRFLAELKMWLLDREEVDAALMSGSGSTVFAVLREEGVASTVVEAARREVDPQLWSWWGWTAGRETC